VRKWLCFTLNYSEIGVILIAFSIVPKLANKTNYRLSEISETLININDRQRRCLAVVLIKLVLIRQYCAIIAS
jgi:hypothetical protein